jgi:hypothetical protein
MEKDDERRAEQRLRYRWPVRFAAKTGEKPLSGQMFDVSSGGMAFLFHASESCPRRDQSITASFGVPHFDSQGSFDTAFFNRIGHVCRVDNLTSRVNRIAVQFAEPLFFKPGEQDVSESDAQQRLAAKARSVVASKENDENYAEALAKAQEEARIHAKAQAEAQEKLKAEFEAEARAKEKATAEAQARANVEAEKRSSVEEEARRKAKLHQEQMARVKAEAAKEIARIEAETAFRVAEAKAEVRANLHEQAEARKEEKMSAGEHARKSRKGGLVKKVDDFITDRNRIY